MRSHRPSPWIGLAVLVLPVVLVSMDMSVLYLAIPTMSEQLAPTASEQLWIVDIYGFLIAGLLITMGNLGDRFGRRRLLLGGATIFGIASIMAAFSADPATLIAARALMGIGGATLLPSSLSLISNMFPDTTQRAKAIGVWTAFFAGGAAVGPVIGGFLLHHFWWGSVFLINAPVIVLLLAAAPFLLPEFRSGSKAPFDFVGVVLSMVAILPLVYAIKHAAAEGIDGLAIGTGIVGLAALVTFVAYERRLEHPLLDLKLFGNPRFSVAIASALTGMMTLAAMSYLSGIYLQTVLDKDVLAAAFLGIPAAIGVATLSMSSARISRIIGVRWAFAVALSAAAVGNAGLIFVGTTSGIGIYVASSVIAGLGFGLMFSLVSEVALASTPPERAGAATGISETSFELGTALGLAVLGSIATVVFRSADSKFSDTVGETVEHAKSLDTAAQTSMVDSAKSAFVDGLHVASGVGAALLAALTVVVLIVLRPRPPRPETPSSEIAPALAKQ